MSFTSAIGKFKLGESLTNLPLVLGNVKVKKADGTTETVDSYIQFADGTKQDTAGGGGSTANLTDVLAVGNTASGQDITDVDALTCNTLNYTTLNPPIFSPSVVYTLSSPISVNITTPTFGYAETIPYTFVVGGIYTITYTFSIEVFDNTGNDIFVNNAQVNLNGTLNRIYPFINTLTDFTLYDKGTDLIGWGLSPSATFEAQEPDWEIVFVGNFNNGNAFPAGTDLRYVIDNIIVVRLQ